MILHTSHAALIAAEKSQKKLDPDILVPSYSSVRLVSFGFDKLLADLYWLSFISYYGDGVARQKDHYMLADKYLDLITSLDPQFVQPYWFVAFTVGSDQKNPARADELLKRGIDANQNNWYIPYIAGFNQYMFAKNELKAAKYYRMASKFPDAPDWLGRQAKILEAKIPSTIKEINIWNNVYSSVKEVGLKERAREKLLRLWIQVYKRAPSEKIRQKALKNLNELGLDISQFVKHSDSG